MSHNTGGPTIIINASKPSLVFLWRPGREDGNASLELLNRHLLGGVNLRGLLTADNILRSPNCPVDYINQSFVFSFQDCPSLHRIYDNTFVAIPIDFEYLLTFHLSFG